MILFSRLWLPHCFAKFLEKMHAIDQSGEPVSHAGDGGAELAAQASVLRAETGLAFHQGRGPQSQCCGRPVDHMTCTPTEHFVRSDR